MQPLLHIVAATGLFMFYVCVWSAGVFATDNVDSVHEAAAIAADGAVTNGGHPVPEPSGASSFGEVLLLHRVQCVSGSDAVRDGVLVAGGVQGAHQLQEFLC